jgi:hypothetical protein
MHFSLFSFLALTLPLLASTYALRLDARQTVVINDCTVLSDIDQSAVSEPSKFSLVATLNAGNRYADKSYAARKSDEDTEMILFDAGQNVKSQRNVFVLDYKREKEKDENYGLVR